MWKIIQKNGVGVSFLCFVFILFVSFFWGFLLLLLFFFCFCCFSFCCTLRVLIFAGIYFREQKKIVFREYEFSRMGTNRKFRVYNFREFQKNKIFHNS